MSRQDYTAEYGPGWMDVEKSWDHIEQEFNLRVAITIERHTAKGNVRRTLVVTEFNASTPQGGFVTRVARRCWWDRREFKTITAVLYNQALACDAWLTNQEAEAVKQAPLL